MGYLSLRELHCLHNRHASVPEEVLRLARVRSGLDGIETSIALNKKEIEQSTLTAPFDGVVADLKVKRFGIAPTSEPACRIINDGGMQVEFTVLESELPLLHIGDGVEVSPDIRQERHRKRHERNTP